MSSEDESNLVYLALQIRLENRGVQEMFWFHSGYRPLHNRYEAVEIITAVYSKILSSVKEFAKKGSGLVIDRVVSLQTNTSKYSPLRICANNDHKLPYKLRSKHNCFHIVNNMFSVQRYRVER